MFDMIPKPYDTNLQSCPARPRRRGISTVFFASSFEFLQVASSLADLLISGLSTQGLALVSRHPRALLLFIGSTEKEAMK
ncbi:hypothetical protein CVT25_004421 [Psilocybe cyanescens]|uniref:Uncharacterized protein n=1 Tax=Psilocybe cyanescens TaxID=93625 RepID=A0A409XW07_PSICY|nr:hypothetical protein CVT25_004421 [Psilocybe cyanescens]